MTGFNALVLDFVMYKLVSVAYFEQYQNLHDNLLFGSNAPTHVYRLRRYPPFYKAKHRLRTLEQAGHAKAESSPCLIDRTSR